MTAVFDTALVIDYLRGIKRALEAFGQFPDRAITVGTWVEIMSEAPTRLEPQTREFLRGFERLAINEAIADRALALMQQHDRLSIQQAFAWATAQINNSVYVTVDFPRLTTPDPTVYVPYRRSDHKGAVNSSAGAAK
jgi:predicted nucleic acid-binding protein